jgi:hypothetical protein
MRLNELLTCFHGTPCSPDDFCPARKLVPSFQGAVAAFQRTRFAFKGITSNTTETLP